MTHKNGSTRGQTEKPKLFRYANANSCHVQRWTVEYCHIHKWKPFPFPLISPPRKASASFHFYESKEGNKHSLKLIKWWVHSHIFTNLRKEGFIPKIGSYIVCFMSLMQVKSFFVSCLESFKWPRRLQKGSFFVNMTSRSEKEITYPRLVKRSDSFTSGNVTSSLGNILCFEETEKSLNITPRPGSFFIIHFLRVWKREKLYSRPFY